MLREQLRHGSGLVREEPRELLDDVHASATSQRRFEEIEARYPHISTFGALLVPGLLQTEPYMRTVFAGGGLTSDEVEIGIAGRLARQERLDDPRCRFIQIVAEGALRWRAGSADVMADQARRLAEAASRDTNGRSSSAACASWPCSTPTRCRSSNGSPPTIGEGAEAAAL